MQAQVVDGDRPSTLLRHALALLETPDRWTRGNLALDAGGNQVPPWAQEAAQWDCVGALLRAWSELCSPDDNRPFLAATACLRRVAKAGAQNAGLLRWQDDPGRTHTDVLALLRRAILLAEATS